MEFNTTSAHSQPVYILRFTAVGLALLPLIGCVRVVDSLRKERYWPRSSFLLKPVTQIANNLTDPAYKHQAFCYICGS